MTRKTLIAMALCAMLLAASPALAQYNISKPTANDVVVVMRVQIDPPPDDAFFRKLMGIKESDASDHSIHFTYVPKGATLFLNADYPVFGHLGELAMIKIGTPASRTIVAKGFSVWLFGKQRWYVNLPLGAEFDIPAGANYVYLGTLTYHRSDEYFDIDGISKSDEYDAAQEVVRKQFGQDARLYRVNLKEITE